MRVKMKSRDKKKYEAVKKAANPKGVQQLLEESHKINSINKVEAMTKLAAGSTYYGMCQGAYEFIITYKDPFDNTKKAFKKDQKNLELLDKDTAMDFFRSLYDARYGSFKTDF